MTDVKSKLNLLVADFWRWLRENHTPEQIDALFIDDAGYDNWNEVESFFSLLIEKDQLSNLTTQDQTNLLFLIARNWNIGSLIAWLSKNQQLSNMGELKEVDFRNLAAAASQLVDPWYDDAKYQFASSFKKLDRIDSDSEKVLIKFCLTGNDYTKTTSLETLATFSYTQIETILDHVWKTTSDAHAKLACLSIIDRQLNDNNLLQVYLMKAGQESDDDLKEVVDAFRRSKKQGLDQ